MGTTPDITITAATTIAPIAMAPAVSQGCLTASRTIGARTTSSRLLDPPMSHATSTRPSAAITRTSEVIPLIPERRLLPHFWNGAPPPRQNEDRERLEDRDGEEEHHHGSVDREDLVVALGREEVVVGKRELDPHQQRERTVGVWYTAAAFVFFLFGSLAVSISPSGVRYWIRHHHCFAVT